MSAMHVSALCVCQTWGSPCLSCWIFSTRWGKLSSGAGGSIGGHVSVFSC